MNKMLDIIKILDFTQNLPGPICTLYFADMGADVIKVEPPVRGDSLRGLPLFQEAFSYLNRNKKSLELDLKSDEGKAVIYKLVKEYDIILEGFRPGVMKSLGLDYETLKAIQPRLIYCSLSGYGQSGPLIKKAGHDINYLCRSGVASLLISHENEPIMPGMQIADTMGGLQALVGILAACVNRNITGKGQYIDIAITDATLSLLNIQAATFLNSDKSPTWGNMFLSGGLAGYHYYKCADGQYISIAALEPVFAERAANFFNCPLDKKSLADIISQKSRDEWIQLTSQLDICVEPVLNMSELKSDPNISARNMIHNVDGALQPALPIKFSDFAPAKPKSAPALGADNEQIMKSISPLSDSKDV